MIARLDDPYFEAEFTTETTARGFRNTDNLDDADGIFFWCVLVVDAALLARRDREVALFMTPDGG